VKESSFCGASRIHTDCFRFPDRDKVCLDSNKGGCEHQCSNLTDFGYICTCFQGYIIDENNPKRCKGTLKPASLFDHVYDEESGNPLHFSDAFFNHFFFCLTLILYVVGEYLYQHKN